MSPTTLPGTPQLTWPHALLLLAVIAIWGTNFVVIKIGLEALPPLLFATLRFACALLPAVFFLKRPAVSWSRLAAYGVLIGAGQFGLLYLAMTSEISPGLASLVVQTQAFFSIALAMLLTRERVLPYQWFAIGLTACGLGLIAVMAEGDATPLGLALVLLAALSWGSGNIVMKGSGGVNMLAYVVWASLFSVPPLLVLSLIFEGPGAMAAGLERATLATWAAVVWQAVGNTMFGYGIWGWMLARYGAVTVAPTSLLVPVFGMAASAWWFGEALPAWKVGAGLLVLAGLAINLMWPRLVARFAPRVRPAAPVAPLPAPVAGERPPQSVPGDPPA